MEEWKQEEQLKGGYWATAKSSLTLLSFPEILQFLDSILIPQRNFNIIKEGRFRCTSFPQTNTTGEPII